MKYQLVFVEDVQCDEIGNHDAERIEAGARLLLANGGHCIAPLVIRCVGVERYVLVHGEFQLACARRAFDIDPIKGEVVGCFVAQNKADFDTLAEQVRVFFDTSL